MICSIWLRNHPNFCPMQTHLTVFVSQKFCYMTINQRTHKLFPRRLPTWFCNVGYHTIVTESVKTRHNGAFSNSLLLNIYNLLSRMHAQAKFQPCMPTTFGVTALQSSSNRKIDLYSKYWENKLQVLTKTTVTYKCNAVQSCNFHHHVRHE